MTPGCSVAPDSLVAQVFNSALLTDVATYLRQTVAPQAAQLDRDPVALRSAFQELGERRLLGLRVPQEWQGSGVDDLTFRAFQELVARYSGALAFLQTQHQSAAAIIAQSANQVLKQEILPHLSSGQRRLGLGFSQLRRVGEPAVQALPTAGGYRISGTVPWITGYGCFQEFILGATLPSGEAVLGLVPLPPPDSEQPSDLCFSAPLPLAAMASTNTVTATLSDWFLPQDRVIGIRPAGWIHQNDRQNVLHHGFFALGCAQAGLDILSAAQHADYPFITATLDVLQQELNTCRTAFYTAQATGNTGIHQLPLRAAAIELAGRCAQAAVAVSRGAANGLDHPAQRVYREALAFTIFGQTTAVMAATLARLSRLPDTYQTERLFALPADPQS
ncbi:MAG: acyl-CoA/acyl-ACP dehydrogenase [Synechococcales cyanobacterium C42_A2020_086]|jgi:alkylation response protein AidB-like acyl-CoA dehydrogenase|nr:acyl-CoA/acyl-ACP dehydrogenase [Synechococcales cyanobacterium C42_A2020_086]